MDRTDPTARALALLGLLQTGRSWSGADLAERLAISLRTLRRDVDRLRTLGYAVLTRPGPGGTYRLTGGTAMVPLLFDDDEAIATVTALAVLGPRLGPDDPAQRALAKLQQNLPARLARRAAAAADGLEVLSEETSVVDPGVIGMLADAAVGSGRVRFGYERSDGETATRTVDPYGQVYGRGHWYLLAWDLDRDDWRVFRLDRITAVERRPGVFDRRDLPAATVADYLTSDFGRSR
jgi:predicted DNA-binding transcriptional regulator YafY